MSSVKLPTLEEILSIISEIRDAVSETIVWLFWDWTGNFHSYEWYKMTKEERDKLIKDFYEEQDAKKPQSTKGA